MSEAITLPENLQQSLQEIADAQGRNPKEVLEDALKLYLASQKTGKLLPKSIGMGSSEVTNLSERVDELLWQI